MKAKEIKTRRPMIVEVVPARPVVASNPQSAIPNPKTKNP